MNIYNFLNFCIFSLGLCLGDSECPNMPQVAMDRRINTSFRIVQYNVEWLFIDYYSAADCPGEGCTWKNSSEANIHLNYVNNVINKLKPDIINFAEIEGCDELKILLNTNSGYLPYLKKGTDSATGQNVGFLTKIDPIIDLYRSEERISYPIPGSKCGYTGTPGTSGVSKHYITEFYLYGYNVAFIGAHLLAFPTDKMRCSEREAQAQVLQNIIYSYVLKEYEIILLGDFNDFDGEILDANNNKPISQVLDILKGNKGLHADSYKLYSVSENINQSYRFSDWYDKNNNCISSSNEFSLIDHILISSFLREKMLSAFIYQDYDEYCGKYNSDHYPIVVDFDYM
jgi:exonuclease III